MLRGSNHPREGLNNMSSSFDLELYPEEDLLDAGYTTIP